MKRILSLLLVLCLTFSLSACNKADSFCAECGEEISLTDKFCGFCGANTSGDNTSGDIIFDDNTSEDNTSEDNISKDTTNKDTTSKDNTSEDNTSKDTTSKDTTSEDNTSKDTTSEDNTSEDNTNNSNSADSSSNHVHSYFEATCTEPRRCSCGATTGNPYGHSYRNATCTEASECIRCGETTGSPLGHNYNGGKCSRCRASSCSAGHSYNEGFCSVCGDEDYSYFKTYYAGQKWVVDGQWEFTIDSVTAHNFCNSYANDYYTGYEQCVMLTYSYKNLGYSGSSGLFFNHVRFSVYDENGELSKFYISCNENKMGDDISIGKSCIGAKEAHALPSKSKTITIEIEVGKYNGSQRARFVVPVT